MSKEEEQKLDEALKADITIMLEYCEDLTDLWELCNFVKEWIERYKDRET